MGKTCSSCCSEANLKDQVKLQGGFLSAKGYMLGDSDTDLPDDSIAILQQDEDTIEKIRRESKNVSDVTGYEIPESRLQRKLSSGPLR
jgi:hypothetical protein